MSFNDAFAREKTLGELEKEAKANRDAYNKAKNQKALSEKERAEAIKQKAQIEIEIKTINNQLVIIEKDVEKLQKDIEKKDKEIKKIMKFVQVSNGESAYLEYAFGASSFTDFIYRVSVAEQLSNYNDELIKGYNQDIKNLEQKQKELVNKQTELSKKEQELTILEARLTKEIETIKEGMLSKDAEYKVQLGVINSMKSRGCTSNDTVTTCQRKTNNNLASTSASYIPIARGYITSDYGNRIINGVKEFHTGIDFAASTGTSVYPVADGQVVATIYNASCGNHMVYVKHNINGHSYVTSYWHLSTFSVSNGRMVNGNTIIGKVAAPASVTGDRCGGGSHVHLNLFDNAGGKWEASAARGFPNSGRINPRKAFPNIPHPKSDGHGGYIPYPVSHN